MPLPKNNLYPDFNISRLSHIELGVKDLEAVSYTHLTLPTNREV